MVDAADLKSAAAWRGGSSPPAGIRRDPGLPEWLSTVLGMVRVRDAPSKPYPGWFCWPSATVGERRFGASTSVVQVAREAPTAGRTALPEYGKRLLATGRHLAAALRAPGAAPVPVHRSSGRRDVVMRWAELPRALDLAKVPRCSTLAHASRRILADAEAVGFHRRPGCRDPARPQSGPDRACARCRRGCHRTGNPAGERTSASGG